jgi:hypothetical protein
MQRKQQISKGAKMGKTSLSVGKNAKDELPTPYQQINVA